MIGVLAIQGDVSEHVDAAKRALEKMNENKEVVLVRRPADLEKVTHLVIPGGESTTISRILERVGLRDSIIRRAREGSIAIMGTCAGSILMAKKVVDDSRVKTLELMDMEIQRNAFGRQRESFEMPVYIEGIGDFPAVFIRAPIIKSCHGDCRVLSKIKDGILMAKQERFLALVFHPELTNDTRIYEMFLKM